MLAADRYVVRCLHAVVRSKISFSMVQKPGLPRAVLSNFLGFGRKGCTPFPVLLQKRFTHTNPRARPSQQAPDKSFIHRTREQRLSRSTDEVKQIILREVNNHPEFKLGGSFTKFAERFSSTLQREGTSSIFESLHEAYIEDKLYGINAKINYIYHGSVANRNVAESDVADQKILADLRYPTEWYPETRQIQRSIHLHVGPTNSGKTYNALKCLEKAKSGVYAGPLRLLAHEVFTTLNAKGIPCNLITGDDKQIKEGETVAMTSCTVEMAPINENVDLAIVDEIQMIEHPQRGWAWTQALLGLKAKELHLCGEDRTVPLIRELAALMGDKLEIHRYERLSPLQTMSSSLDGDLSKLRKGDCVVAFSRLGIHALKSQIQEATKKRVAVVYGSLPPEIRTQQARLFNEPDNDYDFLVASDAIGMGLNLSIKRIIFESSWKFDGIRVRRISFPQLKQIAGRAGRYRVAPQPGSKASISPIPSPQNLGLVTAFNNADLPYLRKAMRSAPEPVMTAGLLPPTIFLSRFATLFPPRTPFSYILLRLHDLAVTHPRFHLCDLHEQVNIAEVIEPVENLTVRDRAIFCAAPANTHEYRSSQVCKAFASCVANNGGGALLELSCLNLEMLDGPISKTRSYLADLELLHKALVLYLWLSYRFDGIFISQGMAVYVKGLVETRMDKILGKVSVHLHKSLTPIRNKQGGLHQGPEATSNQDQAPNFDPILSVDDSSTQPLASDTEIPEHLPDEISRSKNSLGLRYFLNHNQRVKHTMSLECVK